MAALSEAPPTDVPRLASDVELIGRFEDSGFKEPPYIARRRDGQVVQLAPLLYALAEEVDGRRDTGQIAEALSQRIQRGVDAEMVEMLLDEQLRRLGLVKKRDGITGEVRKADPLLALKFRTKVVPAGFVRAVTTVLRPLFWTPVVVAVLAGLLAVDVWLFGVHGVSQGLRHVLYQPALLFLLVGGVVVATAFHEFGHATAVRYGGAEPGVMGVGVYIVWPAFYTDITDAYRLGKWGRLRADTGGMYFNAIFALAAAGAYAATGFEPLLLLIVLQNFAIVQQSLPLLRLDGYYIVSDLTGVPDMLSRIRPVLASLLPWREPDDRVTELKPWVRGVVTAYVVTVVPALLLLFAVMLVHAPRAFATAWDSLGVHWARVGDEPLGPAAKDVFQMVLLTLPCLGMLYTTGRIGRRAALALPRRAVLTGGLTAAVCLAFLWWPRGDAYRPIQPDERGTLVSGVRGLGHAARQAAPAPVETPAPAAEPAPVKKRPTPRKAAATTPTTPQDTVTTEDEATTTVPSETTTTETTPTDTTGTTETEPSTSPSRSWNGSDSPPPEEDTTTEPQPAQTAPEDPSGSSVYPGGE